MEAEPVGCEDRRGQGPGEPDQDPATPKDSTRRGGRGGSYRLRRLEGEPSSRDDLPTLVSRLRRRVDRMKDGGLNFVDR